ACQIADPLPQEVPNFVDPNDESRNSILQQSAAASAAWAAMDDGADIIVTAGRTVNETSWAPVVARALDEEVLIVSAGPLLEEDSPRPSSLNGVVNVGMSGPEGLMTERVYGMDPSHNRAVLAPGVNVLAPGHNYEWRPGTVVGTSYAAAVAAGVLALGLEKHQDATPHQVLTALLRT